MASSEYKKAGIVVYGTNKNGERALIMPYSEGRFGFVDKYYVLPKGSIDKGEEVRAAAIRETQEETGVDITRLIGEQAVKAFLKGEKIEVPFDSPGYPNLGIRILHIGMMPVSHTYTARSGKERATAMFGIEVENIEALAPYLKNQRNTATEDLKVRESIMHFTQDSDRCPNLTDFLSWLRTGNMPERPWNEGKPKPLPLYAGQDNNFRELEHNVIGHPIESLADWKRFNRDMDGKDFSKMQGYYSAIKQALHTLGITHGDMDIIKLDDKDTPLQFFQEGADIITAKRYLQQCAHLLRENPDYALAFGGGGASKDFKNKPRLHIRKSQFVAIAPYVPPMELKQAVNALASEPAWRPGLMQFSESGLTPFFELHPAFTASSPKQPDYFTSRISAKLQMAEVVQR